MTAKPITVHLILHAHIDPVWLWPWQAGMDEMIATCRSACDRLDRNDDAIFTLGDAWGYYAIERTNTKLFERMRKHIADRRWEIVGGWWLQPDCNLPSARGLAKQIELGRGYFLDRFGIFPRIGFNVDSFGHAASLPSIMRGYGQDRYVMMRPKEHELHLPSRLFRWRGFDDEGSVVTFRIASRYDVNEITENHILASIADLPPGVSHTMCFIGAGDHGGGPTERQLEWCRSHADAVPGCRLVFSTPSRFFDAVQSEATELPVVTGELQHHAVGCYTVMRPVKVAVRDAEHLLSQAEITTSSVLSSGDGVAKSLSSAWERVCFAHFHDVLGGTCIPSAYPRIEDQLGYAKSVADEILQVEMRRALNRLAPSERQRIALFNASDRRFNGYLSVDPWTETAWDRSWQIVTEQGESVQYQLMQPEAAAFFGGAKVLLKADVDPVTLLTLSIDRNGAQQPNPPPELLSIGESELSAPGRLVQLLPTPRLAIGDVTFEPQLTLFEDTTDTWSHDVVRIGTSLQATASWEAPLVIDRGPLMVSAKQTGTIGASELSAEWRLYNGEPGIELLLFVSWRALHQVLKLIISLPQTARGHIDGIPGTTLPRQLESIERPIRDLTLLDLGSTSLGIVCPDVFGIEAQADALALTLLRSPLMAHHDPFKTTDAARALPSDQGVHTFRFWFVAGSAISVDWLECRASMYHRPLVYADWTDGMPARSDT